MKVNKWLTAGLGILISSVFLVLAFRNLKPEEVFTVIGGVNIGLLAVAPLVFLVTVTVLAWRWGFLLRSIKPIPLFSLVKLVLIGYMGNNVYPFRTGEVLRVVLLQRFHAVPAAKGAVTVIVERVFDGLVMLVFILVSVSLLHISSPEIQTMTSIATPLFLLAIAMFFVLAARPNLFRRVRANSQPCLTWQAARCCRAFG